MQVPGSRGWIVAAAVFAYTLLAGARAKMSSKLLLALGAVVSLTMGASALAQIKLPTENPGASNVPTQQSRTAARLAITNVELAPDFSARWSSPLSTSLRVFVRNSGGEIGHYSLAAELEGIAGTQSTGSFSVAPGGTQYATLPIRVQLLDAGRRGNELPMSVLLYSKGSAQNRYDLRLPVSPTPGSSSASAPPSNRDNLQVVCGAVASQLTIDRVTVGSRGGRQVSQIGFTAILTTTNVSNTSRSRRWGYPATLTYLFYRGTPDSGLSRISDAPLGGRLEVPGNFAAGGTRTLPWTLAPATMIQPGLWHTLHVELNSAADSDRSDNGCYLLFMYDDVGRLVEHRSRRAPPPRVVDVTAPR